MRTTLKLEAESYAKALKDIRDANANAQSIEVSYVPGEAHEEVSRYFLKYPNFELNAYALKDRKYDLSKYQHTGKFPSVTSVDLAAALSKGGEGKTAMNERLSVVVCLICEAARSEPIEQAMQAAIAYEYVDGALSCVDEHVRPHAHVQARKAHCRRVAAAAVAGLHRLRQIHEVHRR